jgi:hypothetical protein
MVDISPAQHFMCFDRIDWNRAFFREAFVQAFARQLQPHLGHQYLVVLVLHNIQRPGQTKRGHSSALTWSTNA